MDENNLFDMVDNYNKTETLAGKDSNDNTFEEVQKARSKPLTEEEHKLAEEDFERFQEKMDNHRGITYVRHEYSEEFIKWAQTPISEEEFHNLSWGISTPNKTYSQILAENPISEEETRRNEEELLRLFNSLPISGEDEMCEKKNVNGVTNE